MIIGSQPPNLSETPKMLYDGYQFKRIQQKKILGLIIDDHL